MPLVFLFGYTAISKPGEEIGRGNHRLWPKAYKSTPRVQQTVIEWKTLIFIEENPRFSTLTFKFNVKYKRGWVVKNWIKNEEKERKSRINRRKSKFLTTKNPGAKGFRAKIFGWGTRGVQGYTQWRNGNRKTKYQGNRKTKYQKRKIRRPPADFRPWFRLI